MAPPPVTIYVTSLTSQPKVRQHTDLLHRSLKALEIPYEAFDLVMDQEAKTRWQRAKPPGVVVGLPGYLVGGEWVGTMEDFEEAVETQTLPQFLKQDADTTSSSSAPTVGQAELERLMREMSDADLDALAGELGVEGAGKVGLLVPDGASGAVDEKEGVKSTVEKIENPELGLEKKLAEVEIGGKIESTPERDAEGESDLGTAGVAVAGLSKLEDAVVGAEKDTGAKEKQD